MDVSKHNPSFHVTVGGPLGCGGSIRPTDLPSVTAVSYVTPGTRGGKR